MGVESARLPRQASSRNVGHARDVRRLSTVLAAVGIVVLWDTSDGFESSVDRKSSLQDPARFKNTVDAMAEAIEAFG